MDVPTYWRIIAQAKAANHDQTDEHFIRQLVAILVQLPQSDIIAFDTILYHFLARSYTQDLWAAIHIIRGGCSDDCFDYFRGWLIAQGEVVFQRALDDPKTLLDVIDVERLEAEPWYIELEHMLRVAQFAYEQTTGQTLWNDAREPWVLIGEEWDDATVDARFPDLAAVFNPTEDDEE